MRSLIDFNGTLTVAIKLLVGVILFLSLTWVVSVVAPKESLEEISAEVHAYLEGCNSITPEQNALCVAFGKEALEYAQKHEHLAEIVPLLYATYGSDAVGKDLRNAWNEVLDAYGYHGLLVIRYYYEEGNFLTQTGATVKEKFMQAWNLQVPTLQTVSIPRAEYGRIGIIELQERGHDLLSEFLFKDGKASLKPVTSAARETEKFFASGIKKVEELLVGGEEVTATQWAYATGDVVVLLVVGTAAYKALAKRILVAKGSGVRGLALLKPVAIGFGKSVIVTGKTVAKPLAYGTLVYVAVIYPTYIPTKLSKAFELAGYSGQIGSWIGYTIVSLVLIPIALFLGTFLFGFVIAGKIFFKLFRTSWKLVMQ